MRLRFRYLFTAGGSALVLGALCFMDPDGGQSTALWLLWTVKVIVAVLLAHLARKALFDYPEADARQLFMKGQQHPVGAAVLVLAMAIVLYGLIGLFGRAAQADTLAPPAAAQRMLPVLAAEQRALWPDAPMPSYLGGLVEHESCSTLKSAMCWSPAARLKSDREEGAGMPQLTRAWSADGRQRFDKLSELRARYAGLREKSADLSELSWANVYQRPDLQLRAVVLMTRDLYRSLAMVRDPLERQRMADAAYNGGLDGLQKERMACGLAKGCDPQRWTGHVELKCLKSRQALYAGRSACDINRHHVSDVIEVRAPKYRAALG
ncbi:hypothetical protein ACFJGW_00520 [Burkholderiaceae bacterium UC74_6]